MTHSGDAVYQVRFYLKRHHELVKQVPRMVHGPGWEPPRGAAHRSKGVFLLGFVLTGKDKDVFSFQAPSHAAGETDAERQAPWSPCLPQCVSRWILTGQEVVVSHEFLGFRLQAGDGLQGLEAVQRHTGGEVDQDPAQEADASGTPTGKHLVQLASWGQSATGHDLLSAQRGDKSLQWST